jgi:hypothetical protein
MMEVNKMANSFAKRYHCLKCGTEVLCTKSGQGEAVCCGKTMKIQVPRGTINSTF